MVYELRFYFVEVGRIADNHRRMRDLLPNIFERHGVRVVGKWTVSAGPKMPMFMYLIAWPDLVARGHGWAGFHADPEWVRIRRETNNGSELIEGSDVFFLAPNGAWKAEEGAGQTPVGGVHELIVQNLHNGQAPAVREFLSTVTLPAARRLGARVLGVFDLTSGAGLPAVLTFLAWPDAATRARAYAELENDTTLRAAFDAQRAALGRALFGRATVYLLEPAPYALPLPSFGQSLLG